jgi:hypothetical protein
MEKHSALAISPNQRGRGLTAEIVFDTMLSKNLVQAGLNFVCPRCELEFWRSLDQLRAMAHCEYCEHDFNVLPQLKDRDWRYRRSGLLGNYDNQEGAIPVILALQQIMAVLSHPTLCLWTTAHALQLDNGQGRRCETDFLLITLQPYRSNIEVVIGECKTYGTIDQRDVDNLTAVGHSLRRQGMVPYVVFAKASDFTEEELERIAPSLRDEHVQVILLGKNELEPYMPYERAQTTRNLNRYPVSLLNMAENTRALFFPNL